MNHVTFWPLTAAVNNPVKKMSKCQIVASQSERLPNCSSCGVFALIRTHQKGFKEKPGLTGVKVHWCTKGRWFSQPEEITRFRLLKNCFTSHKWLFVCHLWRQDALWEQSKCFVQRSAVKLGSRCFDRCHLPKHRCRRSHPPMEVLLCLRSVP